MADANTTILQYLGKYVSFTVDHHLQLGVINAIVYDLDGSIQFSIGWDDFYHFSKVDNLKQLGEVIIYK